VTPPPYQPPAVAAPRDQDTTSGIAKGFSAFTESFKAMASGFLAKPDPFVSPLCQAASRGEITQIKGLLAQGANINGRNEDGNTSLICAILANQEEAARYLLDVGADPATKDSSRKIPPVFHAASVGSIGIAKLLLDRGVNANEKSWSGQAFFSEVVASENLEGVRLCLDHGADVNSRGMSGRPILAQAIRTGNAELVKLLLQNGADVKCYDYTGQTMLSIAINQEQDDMIQVVLDAGADPNSYTMTGQTVLVEAIQKRRLGLARILLDRGADANCRDIYGHLILLVVLKDAKIRADEKLEIIRLLLTHGSAATTTDSYGIPAVSYALNSGSTELVALLLRHGASANANTTSGETLLLHAIDTGKQDLARLLLNHGANPNTADKKGRTPLIQALRGRDRELVRLLRDHGANAKQTGVIAPLDFAQALGDREILESLGVRSPLPQTEGGVSVAEAQGQLGSPSQREASSPPDIPPPSYDATGSKS